MKNRKGSSLIEVVMALAILMIIANMMSVVFSFTIRNYVKLKIYNDRLNAVEYLSKNFLHNYNCAQIYNLIESDLKDNKVFLDLEGINENIYSLSVVEIIRNHKNNLTGDIEVEFIYDKSNINKEVIIVISCNILGNTKKEYKIEKRSYGN